MLNRELVLLIYSKQKKLVYLFEKKHIFHQ
jgi:hypothetical protein